MQGKPGLGIVRLSAGVLAASVCGFASPREIAVDVGHLPAEPGALSARGVPELEFNRALAVKVAEALRAAGFAVRLIGARGEFATLQARTRAARGADLFISIHHDSVRERLLEAWNVAGAPRRFSDRFAGYSLFVSRANPQFETSLACASAIGAALRMAGFSPSRYHADPTLGEGRAFADEANGVHYFDNLAVARSASMPALLIEAGVIVNRAEETRLAQPATRQRIARAIAQGAAQCLNRGPAARAERRSERGGAALQIRGRLQLRLESMASRTECKSQGRQS